MNPIAGIIPVFRDMKLKNKIILFYGILFIIPLMIISMVIFQVLSKSLLTNMEYSAGQGYEQSLSFLEYKLYRTIKLSDVVVTDTTIGDILTKDQSTYSIHQQLLDLNILRRYLQTLEDEGDVYKVKIYVPDSLYYSKDGSLIFGLEEADHSKWYARKKNHTLYFSPGQYLEEKNRNTFIALVRNLVDQNHYNLRTGVMRIDIAKETMVAILAKANPTSNSVTCLINSDGVIVAESDDKLVKEYGLTDSIPKELGCGGVYNGSSLKEITFHGEKFFMMKQKVSNTDWVMVTVIPSGDFMKNIGRLRYLILFMVLGFGIVTYYVASLLISSVVKRISRLIESMQEIKKGNMDVHLENNSRDEIGILYDNYNEMIQKTNLLLQEKYRMGIELKSAELKALHSQINPHFLYNTLDMINWLGYESRAEEIHSVVVSLSKFYRLTLNKGKEVLTVEEELKHVGYYLNIESIRLSGRINYRFDVDKNIKDLKIPNVTLQPLVENAIHHGILEKEDKKGKIEISGMAAEDKAYLYVKDDGVGMEEEILKSILVEPVSLSGSGYGLFNVNERIRLLFGEEYGLSFISKMGEGTTAIICIPGKQG